jgi:TolB-like protein/Flp pilus assembly protein TadD
MNEFMQRLKERKLVQWSVAYVAAAFALLQGIDIVAQRFGWPEQTMRFVIVALSVGFFVTLVLAWYHGERGAQRVTGTELLILALLLAIGGGFLWRFASVSREPAVVVAMATPANVPATPASSPLLVGPPAKSIAVLPFENLSAEKENAYFVEGIQDEILTRLAKISALKVISRTSTMRYASRPDNLRQIGRELGVATILEGSVQRDAGAVRVNLQLIDAGTDTHLWAETYDREVKNIFSVESEVAQKVADALKATLLPAESAQIASVPTKNPAAYDLFLQGQYLFNQLQTSSAKDPVAAGQAARDFYRRAIAADPDFALAYARLSYLESYLHWYGVDTNGAVVDDARANADRALALQPELPEAHMALGYVHYWCHRDYPAALSEFAIARASLPNDAEVLAAVGYVHRRQGVASRGIPEMQQASLLDPRDSTLLREIANSYTALRRYAEAEAYYVRSLALLPDDFEAVAQRATSTMLSGDLEGADRILAAVPPGSDPQGSISLVRFKLAMIQRQPNKALSAIAQSPDWLMTRWEHSVVPIGLLRGQALAMKGQTAPARAAFLEAEKRLQERLNNSAENSDTNSYLGLVYAGLGQKEAALKAARAAVQSMPMSRDVIVGAFQLERLARTEAQVGEVQSAVEHLDQLMSSAGGETVSFPSLGIDPAWDAIRADARFKELLEKYSPRVK